jgi:UDP:flavonoid glycosyltransferase YjiC (YdhE family)
VPLIVIPQQVEQLLNARCVEERHGALVINKLVVGKEVEVDELRAALETVLYQPSYHAAATELKKLLRATGGYRKAADELQAYIAGAGRGQRSRKIGAITG